MLETAELTESSLSNSNFSGIINVLCEVKKALLTHLCICTLIFQQKTENFIIMGPRNILDLNVIDAIVK